MGSAIIRPNSYVAPENLILHAEQAHRRQTLAVMQLDFTKRFAGSRPWHRHLSDFERLP